MRWGLVRYALPALKESKGRIVLTGSVAGVDVNTVVVRPGGQSV
ncbi:hypothetical protein [Streptomyces sp. BBFR102]